MDTKWKNRWKIIGWFALLVIGVSSLLIVLNQGNEYTARDYFETGEFQSELDGFLFNISRFELEAKSLEEALDSIVVTEEDIEEHRYYYGELDEQIQSIRDNYEYEIDRYEEEGSSEMADMLREERDEKIADIRLNFNDDEHVAAKVEQEKERQIKENYSELEEERGRYLRSRAAFDYYLFDNETGAVFTNLSNVDENSWEKAFGTDQMHFVETFKASDGTLLGTNDYGFREDGDAVYGGINDSLQNNYEGAVGVPRGGSSFLVSAAEEFQQRQLILLGLLVVGLGSVTTAGFTRKKVDFYDGLKTSIVVPHVKRVPPDVVLAIWGFIGLGVLIFGDQLIWILYYLNDYSLRSLVFNVFFFIVFTSFFLLLIYYSYYTWKEETSFKGWVKKTVCYRLFVVIKNAFEQSPVGIQVMGLMAVVFAFGVGLPIIFMDGLVFIAYGFAGLFIGLPLLYVLLRRVGYFNQIMKQVRSIVAGQSIGDLPVKGRSVLAELARSLNQMKEGVSTSRQQQAKSERLKTELITNVSHDLRTPLTSVITYTELLRNENLSEDERTSYIDIIDRKSQRLKILIEDLFEASKMASGSIELNKDRVDLKQLLTQTLAENSQAIEASSLHFRVNEQAEALTAYVDGQKLWRVFDNLIVNILNYSLAETRVYIDARTENDLIKISFKNITRYELGANTEELFERFKRGDTSRNTEGSGLGLAIAKSIVDLHDGDLVLEADGDLFKATVILPAG